MKHGLGFTICGLALAVLAVQSWPWGALYLWPAISFLLVGAAYLGLGVGIFGKRPDGSLTWWSYVLLGPYLLYAWCIWRLLVVFFSREGCCHEVSPGLWLSRRPVPADLPESVRLVVDLTSEFPSAVAATTGYLALPILDASVPGRAEFLSLVERLAAEPQPLLIHCAQGHGRTGTLAIAILIRRGLAPNVDDALAQIRRIRPGVSLNRSQRAFLAQIAGELPAPTT
jgi:protein-tyrosine phosphatase